MATTKVGTKLNLIRRAQGLTVGAFAKKCRIPESTMDRICSGYNEPSARNLYKIMRYGQVSIMAFDDTDFTSEE